MRVMFESTFIMSHPGQPRYFKLVIRASLSNARHIRLGQHKNWLTRCQNNMTGWGIIRLCLRCDISERQHYKVVIIASITSWHRTDMT